MDNSPVSQDVITLADQWAQQIDAKMFFLHARDNKLQNMVDDGVLIEPKEVFEHYIESANCVSPYEVMHRFGRAYQAILDAEMELEPDLVVMTAHDHTMLGRAFLGSNTDHVLHDGKTPMFVYKQPKKEMVQSRAVVPIDYTPVSEKLVKVADEWALRNKAELYFLHVHEMPEIHNVSAVGGGYYSAGYDYEGKMHDNATRVEEFENYLRDLVRMQGIQSPYQIRIDFGNHT